MLVAEKKSFENVFNVGIILAFEVCGEASPWLTQNTTTTDDDKHFYCPSGNTCCRMLLNDGCNGGDTIEGETCYRESWGCAASDMGAKNATCCSQDGDGNTGCPSGYECRRREDKSSGNVVYDCQRKPMVNNTSGDDNGGDPFMRVLPRYRLCLAEESNRKLYGLPVEAPSPPLNDSLTIEEKQKMNTNLQTTSTSKLAYYSNLGPIDSDPKDRTDDFHDNWQLLAGVEMALIVVHGANRNGDDYFCSAKATIDLQTRYKRPEILVIAPLFLASPSGNREMLHGDNCNSSSFLYWNDIIDKNGSWRYGADATGPATISSFDALDAIVTRLKSASKFPNLRRIVVAGHSSGGQFVQRWSLLTSRKVWPPLVSPSMNSVAIHAVVANPSSYAYLTPLRFFDKDQDKNTNTNETKTIDNDTNNITRPHRMLRTKQNTNKRYWSALAWRLPSTKDCPGYNQWEWGLDDGGFLDVPYRKRAFSRQDRSSIIEGYLRHRSVTYLIGNLDRCSKGERKTQVNSRSDGYQVDNNDQQCDSHGLETTCADQLQGLNRYERNARYWASLELVTASRNRQQSESVEDNGGLLEKAPFFRHNHDRVVVQNSGHDHSMMFQSEEGIAAIYYSRSN